VVNYMIGDGLARAGQHEAAEAITRASLDLIRTSGFAEYYDPHTGEPSAAGGSPGRRPWCSNSSRCRTDMRILAIGAHPDDLEIYAWGALCAWAAMGAELVLAVATDGAAGGRMPPAELARAARRPKPRTAAQALGTEPVFLGFPDGGLATEPRLVPRLVELVRDTAPDLVLSHAPNDYHADHRALSRPRARPAASPPPSSRWTR
jgi:hypothetical protein